MHVQPGLEPIPQSHLARQIRLQFRLPHHQADKPRKALLIGRRDMRKLFMKIMRPLGQDGMGINRRKQNAPSLRLEFAALTDLLLVEVLIDAGLVGGELFHLFEDLIDLRLKRFREHASLMQSEDHRDREIDAEPHYPAEHHDYQQNIGESMNIPSKLKASMQRDDQESQKSEVHMSTRPTLERAEVGEVPAFPNAQKHEHQNRDQPDPSVNETPDSVPRENCGSGVIGIAEKKN